MSRLDVLIFIFLAPTLAGIGTLVPLTMASTGAIDWKFLVGSAAVGVLVSIPFSIFIAKKIKANIHA